MQRDKTAPAPKHSWYMWWLEAGWKKGWQPEAKRSAGTLTLKVSFHWKLQWGKEDREKDVEACVPYGSGAQLQAHLAWPARSSLFYRNSQGLRELPQGAGTWPSWLWSLSRVQPLYRCFKGFPITATGICPLQLICPVLSGTSICSGPEWQ